MVRLPRNWFPTPVWVRAAIAPALVFIALASDRSYLADFWHHLARGRAIVQQGKMVDQDLFSFTVPGRAFQDVNWLTQVFYFFLYDRGGLELVQVVNALVLAGTIGLLVAFCCRCSGSLGVAVWVAIFVFFGLWQILTIRPQTFSLLLFVILYDLLDRSQQQPRWLLPAPLVLALWANLHGAFPAGIMLLGCFLLASVWQGWQEGRLFRRPQTWYLALALAAGMSATLLNPYGWRIYQYVGQTSNIAALRRIDEWVPPSLDLWIGKAWLVSMLAMAGLLLAGWFFRARKPSARALILIGCFLPLASSSVRMVAWWLLVCAPLASAWLADLWPRRQAQADDSRPSWGTGTFFIVIILFCLLSLPGLQHSNPLLAHRWQTPRLEEELEAVHRYLGPRSPSGRIFCRFEWGEYLTWSFAPAYKVFMDGRIEIYPAEVWEDYSAITTGQPRWEKILDDYRVDVLLLDLTYHDRTGLLPCVEKSTSWQRGFQTGPAVVFLRRGTSPR